MHIAHFKMEIYVPFLTLQNISQRLFYLQVKDAIMNDEIYCPPETTVLLASYALQAKFGDNLGESHNEAISNERLLPDRVKEQFNLSPEQWHERIGTWWAEHKGMLKYEKIVLIL